MISYRAPPDDIQNSFHSYFNPSAVLSLQTLSLWTTEKPVLFGDRELLALDACSSEQAVQLLWRKTGCVIILE